MIKEQVESFVGQSEIYIELDDIGKKELISRVVLFLFLMSSVSFKQDEMFSLLKASEEQRDHKQEHEFIFNIEELFFVKTRSSSISIAGSL